ncbi:hypothetical protein VTJ83DRAFT_4705 [Remersonia thermophila]|uniref:C2H2-type domain-containing protein n=1 Tax=Remersonia thermophila TaxID=72144 RepID=A0ABR4DAP8_9PEZI
MDNKHHLASLLEDDSLGTSSEYAPNHQPQAWAWSPDGESTWGTSSRSACPDHDVKASSEPSTLSCVTKETSHEDCARHRFIVWAAVKRNSSVRMTPQERLECPLLRCTQRFPDHESMLKHLAGCRHLASGEYWCYDHSRVERFDDVKCRRCLGHPSKRRKILHLAKSLFHSLGHKPRKGLAGSLEDDRSSILPPPPSYESLDIPPADVLASELSSNEILEIDGIEIPVPAFQQPPPVPGPADVVNPQMLTVAPVPPLPELDSTMLSNDAFAAPWPSLPEGRPSSTWMFAPQEDAAAAAAAAAAAVSSSRASPVRPTLQLATAGLPGRRQASRPVPKPVAPNPQRPSKGLSPSSSVRSTASTDTNASMASNGSSLISPASNWSGAWSMGSGLNTGTTSPVDGVVADDMFADAMSTSYNDLCPDYLHNFYSELPADIPMLDNACDMATSDAIMGFGAPSVPVNMAFVPEVATSASSTSNSNNNNNNMKHAAAADESHVAQPVEPEEPAVEPTNNTCCSETKALVGAAWDALQEHIVTSMVKMQDQKANHLGRQLSTKSIKTVATTGLQTLRSLVHGQAPGSAGDALCMIHLIYALSLVLHEQGAPHRARSMFLHALRYIRGLPPGEKEPYRRLVVSIWQPPDLSLADVDRHLALLSNQPRQDDGPKGKSREMVAPDSEVQDDALLTVARDFLDALEISLLNPGTLPLEVQVSDLHMTHLKEAIALAGSTANAALLATAKDALTLLAQGFGDASLHDRLRDIYRRLEDGSICSARRIEMELLQAGRGCLPSGMFFGEFVPRARRLCDRLYEQHDVGVSRRNDYHGLGLTLIQNLIHELDSSGGKTAAVPLDDLDAFFHDLSSEAGDPCGGTSPPSHQASAAAVRGPQLHTPAATTPSGTPSSSAGVVSPPAEQAHPAEPRQPKALDKKDGQERPAAAGPSGPTAQAGQKVEARSCCDICGYRPKGDPQWFKGSMAKHKKLQHSTDPPKIYKCPYPGCTSQYRNRPDNLRQHQIEKNHWAPGEEGPSSRRPSKRKKVSEED